MHQGFSTSCIAEKFSITLSEDSEKEDKSEEE